MECSLYIPLSRLERSQFRGIFPDCCGWTMEEQHEKHVSDAADEDHTVQVEEEDQPVVVKRLYDDEQEGQTTSSNSHAAGVVGEKERAVADEHDELRQPHEDEGDSIVHVLGTTLEPLVAVVGESARILMGKASPEEEEEEARKVRETAAAMAVAGEDQEEQVAQDQQEESVHGDTGDSREGGKSLGVIMSARNHHGGWNSVEPNPQGTPGTPLLKRLEHLELNLRSFEDKCSPRSVVDGNNYWSFSGSARSSSCLSTPSSIEKRRKPIDDVLEETEEKGTLVERVASLEQRLDTLSMQLSKGDWAPAAVPVLKSPPGRAPKNVASAAPSDLPAVEEKHEVPAINGDSKQAEAGVAQEQHKLKKRHKIPHMLKNCFTPGSAH